MNQVHFKLNFKVKFKEGELNMIDLIKLKQ